MFLGSNNKKCGFEFDVEPFFSIKFFTDLQPLPSATSQINVKSKRQPTDKQVSSIIVLTRSKTLLPPIS